MESKQSPKGRASLFRIEALQARNELRVVGDISPKDDNVLSTVVSVASVLGLLIFVFCLIYPFPVYVDASGVIERTPADAVISSSMPGTVVRLYVKDGQEIAGGAAVACVQPSAQQVRPASQPTGCPDIGGNAFALHTPTAGTVSLASLRETDEIAANQPVISIQRPQAKLVGFVLTDPQKATAIKPEAHATIWPAASPLSRSTGVEATVTGSTIDLGKGEGEPASRYRIRLEMVSAPPPSLLPGMPFRARIMVGSRPLYQYILPGRTGA